MAEILTGAPEVDCSLMSLFDKSLLLSTFSLPASGYLDIIKDSNYSGLEWHPIKNTRAARQMNSGRVEAEFKDSIHSLHQSWRGEKSLFQAVSSLKPIAVFSYLILPERVASLNDLENLQRVLGKELPVVLYPTENGSEESGTERNFKEKIIQPTPEIMQRWHTRTATEFVKKAKRKGYTGLCIDLAHIRGNTQEGYSFEPWRETLPQLLPFTTEIHVSAGRVDMSYENTKNELKDLIKGTCYTELPRMLDLIRQTGWKGRVVTEIPAPAVLGLHSEKSIQTLINDHKEIVYNIKRLLS